MTKKCLLKAMAILEGAMGRKYPEESFGIWWELLKEKSDSEMMSSAKWAAFNVKGFISLADLEFNKDPQDYELRFSKHEIEKDVVELRKLKTPKEQGEFLECLSARHCRDIWFFLTTDEWESIQSFCHHISRDFLRSTWAELDRKHGYGYSGKRLPVDDKEIANIKERIEKFAEMFGQVK